MTVDTLPPPALEADGVTKAFPGVRALTDVSITVRDGEVVGLVGENGAGKSTLLSILSGSLSVDSGEVRVGGRATELASYQQANAAGVFRAHQDQGLIGNLTVAENLYLGHEVRFTVGGLLRTARMRRAAAQQVDGSQLLGGQVDVDARVRDLPLDIRQLVEITRAFAVADLLEIGRPVILLDETTASLNQDEAAELFQFVRAHREHASFVFVSHRLNEILELCDRVYVLKDGQVVAERLAAETSEAELHRLMVGRERSQNHYFEDRRHATFGPARLQVDGLAAAPYFTDVSLEIRQGEIFALGGIAGCGKSHVARAIAGDLKAHGDVVVDGHRLRSGDNAARTGFIAFGPLDRHAEGVSLLQSIKWNITWSSLRSLRRGPFLDPGRERRAVAAAIDRYRIAAPDMETKVGSLSGGNQQKVMLARLVASGAHVLVLDNPTRGVDVGARQEIYGHLRDLADEGIAILVVSDDLNELLGLGDRVAVMKDGRMVHQWDQAETRLLTEELVIARMV
ncbi:Ribose import ATP-binding protein RbsA [Frankia canadensis]|uniref:Ribose import ATP-binding protein RbsA n=1 Tax=Frankia canadensis TaxID=1836972 RepID=A0A2I2KIB0_9ACTN|nr:sugar ABC transporter ATP-binding protein [Frankia canadensis]SNQ45407.1 Ribose import ATP-binding protein RbsA [Frankia canadensis]SOU52697.1 Ribose import ATP-binding protein RbsA [Frankia canadensis]